MSESEVKRGGLRFTGKHEYNCITCFRDGTREYRVDNYIVRIRFACTEYFESLQLISFLTSTRQGASIPTLESTCI